MVVENSTIKVFFFSFSLCFLLFGLLCFAILHEGYQCSENLERCNNEKDKLQFELLKSQERSAALSDRTVELQTEYNRIFNMLEECRGVKFENQN